MLAVGENIRRFTPAQYELVNMMSCLHKESDIVELKSVLVKFLNARIQKESDGLYDDGTLSDERMEELSNIESPEAVDWLCEPVPDDVRMLLGCGPAAGDSDRGEARTADGIDAAMH